MLLQEMKQHQGVKFLTHGSWEVFEVVGVNSDKNLVYVYTHPLI